MKCKKGYKIKEGKCVRKGIVGSSKKEKDSLFWPILSTIAILLIVGVFIFGGVKGWFKSSSLSIINNADTESFLTNSEETGSCSLSLNPNTIWAGDRVTGTVNDGKNTLCFVLANGGDGWKLIYQGRTDNNGVLTETRNVNTPGSYTFRAVCDLNGNNNLDTGDCLTNSEQLGVLAPDTSCTDSDGRDRYTPGWVTFGGDSFYDKCLDVGSAVTEYTCVNGAVVAENLACDYGEECITSRSGGYCRDIVPSWNPGDTVWSGGNSGSIQFASGVNLVVITPEEMGFEVGGPCSLEVQLTTDWNWRGGETACSVQELNGVYYQQHLKWDFYDSAGLRYSRIDPYPRGVSETIYPVNFDGQNSWKLQISTLDPVQGCTIDYNWEMLIKIKECTE